MSRDRDVKTLEGRIRGQGAAVLPRRQRLSPPQLFAGSFALMILFGTIGLRFVPAFYIDGEPLQDM